MAKSIRSKIKKKHRAVQRATVGAAQEEKHMRKTLRRLEKVVAAAKPEDPEAVTIRGAEPVEKVKKLPFTFNTVLREQRVAADLEDLTDDEEEVRLGIRKKSSKRKASASGMDEDDEMAVEIGPDGAVTDLPAVDVMLESGVRAAPSKNGNSKHNMAKKEQEFMELARAGHLRTGVFQTDPLLKNEKRKTAHRKTMKGTMMRNKRHRQWQMAQGPDFVSK